MEKVWCVCERWIMSVMCERQLSPSPSFPVWEGALCPYLFLYPHGSLRHTVRSVCRSAVMLASQSRDKLKD